MGIMSEIVFQLNTFKDRTLETGEDLRKLEQEQESFALQYHECTKLNGTEFSVSFRVV